MFIEPGQEFDVELNGKKVKAYSLSGRQQIAVSKLMKQIDEADSSLQLEVVFEMGEKLLAQCYGEEAAAKMYDSGYDAQMAMTLAAKILLKQQVSEETEGKSE